MFLVGIEVDKKVRIKVDLVRSKLIQVRLMTGRQVDADILIDEGAVAEWVKASIVGSDVPRQGGSYPMRRSVS